MDKKEILNYLKQNYNFCIQQEYELLGVFLFGSQNYGLDGPNSDLDTKAIFFKKKDNGFSFSYERENPEGLINMVSIEEFLAGLGTGYHTWYELLFTEYYIINPKYRFLWETIKKLREQLVHEQIVAHLNAEIKYLNEQLNEMNFVSMADFPYENKRLTYFYRIEYLINNLIDGSLYQDCLYPKDQMRERILHLKLYCPFTVDECKRQAKEITEELQDKVDKYIKETGLVDINLAYNQVSCYLRQA